METQYFALVDGKELGPFSPKAIRLFLQSAHQNVLVRFGESGWIAPQEIDWDDLEHAGSVQPPLPPVERATPVHDPAATLVFGTTRRKKKSNAWPFTILLLLFALAGVFVWDKMQKDSSAADNAPQQGNSGAATVDAREPRTTEQQEVQVHTKEEECVVNWMKEIGREPSQGICMGSWNYTKAQIHAYCARVTMLTGLGRQSGQSPFSVYDQQAINFYETNRSLVNQYQMRCGVR